jgi:hypothetical protein
MMLNSVDGAFAEIRLVDYEFPNATDDLDANWLVVNGRIGMADAHSWTFQLPCLTTHEGRTLATWLRDVPAGRVNATKDELDSYAELVWFTEPNLAFSLKALTATEATIRVHFGLESIPPWLADDDPVR